MVSMYGLDLSFMKDSPLITPSSAGKRARQTPSKRSDLACPHFILDRVEYRSQETGEMITSRSAHREHLKRHRLIEVGNEPVKSESEYTKRKRHREEIRRDLVEALEQKRQGYVAPPPATADDTIVVSTKPVRAATKSKTPKFII